MNDDDWKKKLTDEQYKVLREKGTEAPFSGKLLHNDKTGKYVCAACGNVLFDSNTKFESTLPGLVGWPAFSDPVNNDAVELRKDNSMGMNRTEIICTKCGGHIGHLFEGDYNSPNGMHYCTNSVSLDFKEQK